jgi:hypothetical protein
LKTLKWTIRPDRKRFVKDKLNMAVEIRDPRDVSTILRVLFFMEVYFSRPKRIYEAFRRHFGKMLHTNYFKAFSFSILKSFVSSIHHSYIAIYERKTMHFIDALFPLFGGIYLLVSEGRLLKPMDPSCQRKKRLLKRSAYGLIICSVGYFIISLFA